jgi:osmoprotectant transport system ATP-binding protein
VGAPRSIRFDRVVKEYQRGKRVVDDVSLVVEPGRFVVLLGPSGCGKTTLLKSVNRLVELSAGTIFVDEVDVRSTDAVALRRGMGYVIQQVGLFPHMTIAQNVAVVPSLEGWSAERQLARVHEMLDLVRLPATQFGARFPRELSGGQQQRVGLARALAADPDILLMDEPFGALDAIERSRLQGELLALQRQLRKTVLFVTHDVDEALKMADQIVVMRAGQVVQAGTPLEIIARPADAFVSELTNAGDLVRLLGLVRVADAPLQTGTAPPAGEPTIGLGGDLRGALSAMLASGDTRLAVANDAGTIVGMLTFDAMLQAARSAAAARTP